MSRQVLLLTNQSYGIHYEYTIPMEQTPESQKGLASKASEPIFMWTHSGWEDCHAVCGGGTRIASAGTCHFLFRRHVSRTPCKEETLENIYIFNMLFITCDWHIYTATTNTWILTFLLGFPKVHDRPNLKGIIRETTNIYSLWGQLKLEGIFKSSEFSLLSFPTSRPVKKIWKSRSNWYYTYYRTQLSGGVEDVLWAKSYWLFYWILIELNQEAINSVQ